MVLPHVANKALVALNADSACLQAIGGANSRGALWALQYMYSDVAVDGLISKMNDASLSTDVRQGVARALIRLIHQEQEYTGDTWWGTRPDTRGPFYYPTPWKHTDKIKSAIEQTFADADDDLKNTILTFTEKDRAPIESLAASGKTGGAQADKPAVDLSKISQQKGQVGKMAIEDVLLALDKVKGNPGRGKALFTQQGCVACHTLSKEEVPKGPYMGQIGAIMNRDQIATAILRPNDTISQGFKTTQLTMKDGAVHVGFITERLSDRVDTPQHRRSGHRSRSEEDRR